MTYIVIIISSLAGVLYSIYLNTRKFPSLTTKSVNEKLDKAIENARSLLREQASSAEQIPTFHTAFVVLNTWYRDNKYYPKEILLDYENFDLTVGSLRYDAEKAKDLDSIGVYTTGKLYEQHRCEVFNTLDSPKLTELNLYHNTDLV